MCIAIVLPVKEQEPCQRCNSLIKKEKHDEHAGIIHAL